MNPFIPDLLPLNNLNWGKYVKLVGMANAEIARFDGILQAMIDPSVLLSPLSTNEAVLSSKIEGTQATLQEVLTFEAKPDLKAARYEDIQEIMNYRYAMTSSTIWLKTRPITLGMIKHAHEELMKSVRGQNKQPGGFRTIQNWIGKPGTPISEATFIPPDPIILDSCLQNFEDYIKYDEVDPIIQIAVIHAQFEIIHPFLDGNGRLGRMLIPLFLYQKRVISSPMFYISEYLDIHQDEYVTRLNNISGKGDWDGWVLFFLGAIVEQAKTNTQKTKVILDLYETKKKKIAHLTHSQFAINIVDTLFKMPVFNTIDFIKSSKIPKASASRYLNILVREDILSVVQKGKGRQPNIMVFNKLFDIIR